MLSPEIPTFQWGHDEFDAAAKAKRNQDLPYTILYLITSFSICCLMSPMIREIAFLSAALKLDLSFLA
jgi:hypothetical protein